MLTPKLLATIVIPHTVRGTTVLAGNRVPDLASLGDFSLVPG